MASTSLLSMDYVEESGMKFGPFLMERLFKIEKCAQYIEIQDGMRMTEFIYFNHDKKRIISLEAKTSAPNPKSGHVKDPLKVFNDFITEIREKFENSLDLYINLALKHELPSGFQSINYQETEFVFVLVIKTHQTEWLKEVKDALEMAVRSVIRTKNIWRNKVIVINEEQAMQFKLIN